MACRRVARVWVRWGYALLQALNQPHSSCPALFQASGDHYVHVLVLRGATRVRHSRAVAVLRNKVKSAPSDRAVPCVPHATPCRRVAIH